MLRTSKYTTGFTLIEAVMVMVITGILGALVASFAAPLKGYFDSTVRADLSDAADTALRRMARELHAALPNSVRVSGSYIEFLPTTTGGRYRAAIDPAVTTPVCGSAGDELSFSSNDTCFEVIGTLRGNDGLPAAPTAEEELVVYNTSNSDLIGAYSGDNVATLTSTPSDCELSSTQICFNGGKKFPFESPSQRFQIIGKPVTFACDAATSTLWRYSGYSRQSTQAITIAALDALANVTKARLATSVNCGDSSFTYEPGVTNRAGLITMNLTLSQSDESVTLLHQVHVQNVP